jgi:hypothetical protein
MSERVDKSNHPTVVEYAVRDLFKGKSPAAAARFTAKKLSGSENLFLGSGVVDIDPKVLEDNLWERMAASAVSAIPHLKPGLAEGEWVGLKESVVRIRKMLASLMKAISQTGRL